MAGDATDVALMKRIARRDEDALAVLYDRHAARVYGLALRLTGDRQTAEEIVQDVFLRLWRHAARYDSRLAGPGSWLLIMTRNLAIDRLRANGRQPATTSLPDQMPDASSDAVTLEDRVLLGQVSDALRHVPHAMREILELAYFQGWTHREIAGHLGLPMGTVKTRLRQAVERLRDLMSPEEAAGR